MEEASSPSQCSITKEFLEKVLKQKVVTFKVTEGTNPGDNFTSVLKAIEVQVVDKKEPLYLLMKTFPSHPERQKFLEDTNVFQKEYQIYADWLPELFSFQKEIVGGEGKVLKPAMAEFLGGAAIDYGKGDPKDWEQLDATLSNFILMVDVRKTYGCSMTDKLKPLGYHHVKIILEELAKYHALGHAYRIHHKLPNIRTKFPFMKDTFFDNPAITPTLEGLIKDHMQLIKDICKDLLEEKPEIAESLKKFSDPVLATEYMCMYSKPDGVDQKKVESLLRVPPTQGEPLEEQWITTGHGDCWSNNMLFKTDADGNATQVVMVDLQVARECSIMADIVHFIYMSTDTIFRKKYLDEMLSWYYEKFVEFCGILKVSTFPGFSFANLQRKFHSWKIFGFLYALFALPIVLRRPDDIVDMDTLDVSEEVANNKDGDNELVKMYRKSAGDEKHKILLRQIFTSFMAELHEEGVL